MDVMAETPKLEQITQIASGLVGGAAGLGLFIYTMHTLTYDPVNPATPDLFLDHGAKFLLVFPLSMPAAIIGCITGKEAAYTAYHAAARAMNKLAGKNYDARR
jgi:cell division protein FtsX